MSGRPDAGFPSITYFHEEHIPLLSEFVKLPCLLRIDSQSFLAQDWLWRRGTQNKHRILKMMRVRCGDVDDVDIGVGNEFGIGAIWLAGL